MDYDGLQKSLFDYAEQLKVTEEALTISKNISERESLLELKRDLNQLVELTKESLHSLTSKEDVSKDQPGDAQQNPIDDEYALFMQEMAKEGAYSDVSVKPGCSKEKDTTDDVEIDEELASLLGMKCSVYHTHRWGGQPSLHNAMVCSIVNPQSDAQFQDLQVRVLFTHPTHTEMLPCPFYLNGECRFDDEKCRYSHGTVVPLSNLKDAMEPNFEGIREGTRVLLKLKPPDDEDISLTKKHTEKYHLWHRAVVLGVDLECRVCVVKAEHGHKSGDKRKAASNETVPFENLFPLDTTEDTSSDTDASLSDTEYPESKTSRPATAEHDKTLLVERSFQNNGPAIGEWERHTKGIGSKLMLAMGYVPGSGLGAAGKGRVEPIDARLVPKGISLDHIMALSESGGQDSMKVEQKLKRLQKKEEDRNKRALERERERERRNVFNFLNKTLGDKSEEGESKSKVSDVKQSSSRDLNVELFKILEDIKKVERDIIKLNGSLQRHQSGSPGHKQLNSQIIKKTKELGDLKNKEQLISREQKRRKDKHKMTTF